MTTVIADVKFTERVTDLESGRVKVLIKIEALSDQPLTGVYLGVQWDKKKYSGTNFFKVVPSVPAVPGGNEVPKGFAQLLLPIHTGPLKRGDSYEQSFDISLAATPDAEPVDIKLNAGLKGRMFDGLGGNFRLQNAKTDPQVIDYCLENLRVAWGRVEMPWRNWHPLLETDTVKGNLDPKVKNAMEMAQRLGKMNMPVIVSAWSPPAWAVIGKLVNGQDANGIWGNALDPARMQEIYASISSYLLYLKSEYGVEATYFSFNESDLGINVRQTGQEHADLIKGLGAYFKSKGLKTKLLLGDNSDANTYEFIYPALNDPACRPYIGAISFHSWRGWDAATLSKWAEAATKIDADLLVGEGSIDAAAWQYPEYFQEESYALEEINLYTRLLNICQPRSILQWQLTADYSPLKGAGIFGTEGPLAPTQRFWQLKQLAATPAGQQHIAVSSSRPDVSCAALAGDGKNYTIHLVNSSGGRAARLGGIPSAVKGFKAYLTDKSRNSVQIADIVIKNGKASLNLDPRCFVTLMSY